MADDTLQSGPLPPPGPEFRKVLVVDDITYVLRSISKVLKEQGFFVLTARTARDALASYRLYTPELVTIDQKLPDMTGLQLVDQIRAVEGSDKTKIIFISSVYDKDEIRTILERGIDDYLMKPFKRARLIETVRTVLQMNKGKRGSP